MRRLFEIIFNPLDGMLGAIPLSAARWVTVGFLLLAVGACFLLKKDYVFLGARERHWWLDLRLWALVIMIPYILIYLLL